MSRNLGSSNCYFCNGPVRTTERPRPITPEDAKGYFEEYEGMLVAFAECLDCEAQYLAWIEGTHRKRGHASLSARGFDEKGCVLPADLSFRSTFDDQPGQGDLPRYIIATERRRRPVGDGDRRLATETEPNPAWALLGRTTNQHSIDLWTKS